MIRGRGVRSCYMAILEKSGIGWAENDIIKGFKYGIGEGELL